MLSYVHELSYKPMICSSPSCPLRLWRSPAYLAVMDSILVEEVHQAVQGILPGVGVVKGMLQVVPGNLPRLGAVAGRIQAGIH